MHAGIIADSEDASVRLQACRRVQDEEALRISFLPASDDAVWNALTEDVAMPLSEETDLLFLDLPAALAYQMTQNAIKQSIHVFLERRSAPSLEEAKTLGRLAEEAGVEVGISRPLRYHPLLNQWPAGWRSLLTLIRTSSTRRDHMGWALEDAVDLSCVLAGAAEVQHLDAQVYRGEPGRVDAIAAALRFHNGAYAQLQWAQQAPTDERTVEVAGPGMKARIDLLAGVLRGYKVEEAENAARRVALESFVPPAFDPVFDETRAFIQALRNGRPAPVSIADALVAQRIVEAIQKKLR